VAQGENRYKIRE